MSPRCPAVAVSLAAVTMPAIASADPSASIGERVTPVFERAIPNIPGKSLAVLVVDYAPGGKSASHRHAGSAFIYAQVLSGAVRSQVNDEPARVCRAGENWFEAPGSRHRVSENASATEPARLLAVVVVDEGDRPLTTPDPD
jgi:quercetin dioxygenase-like cupin family protein